MAETPQVDISTHIKTLSRISRAVNQVSNHMPWRKKCFALALAGKLMLRRRGLATTLYLGVCKNGEKGLDAHAWLRCGNVFVTGGDGSEFTVMSSFAEK